MSVHREEDPVSQLREVPEWTKRAKRGWRTLENAVAWWTSPRATAAPPKPKPKVVDVVMGSGAVGNSQRTGYPRYEQATLLALPSIQDLLQMFTTMRPDGSKTEEAFIQQWIVPLGSTKDDFGNRWVRVPKADGSAPDIMFSAHTDTVHRNDGLQKVEVADGLVFAEASNCLGADDTCGIWLMREMIQARVPGLYIFHRAEEVGGKGSAYIAKMMAKKFDGVKAAIAFDRKDYGDVITHQGFSRCCSETFAKSLAALMGGKFAPCDTGVFTDTANYTDIIGECTNLSVGYHMAHGPAEHCDLSFLLGMRDRLVAADWSQLVFERKPGEVDPLEDFDQGPYGWHGGWQDTSYTRKDHKRPRQKSFGDQEEMEDYIYASVPELAEWFIDQGWSVDDLQQAIEDRLGDDIDDEEELIR